MELHTFFLILAVILLAARIFAEVASRYGIPPVIGELAAGLIFGPSLLGWLAPDDTLKILAEIGVILLLFEVGMDTDVFRLAKAGAKPVIVAVAGFILPFTAGFIICYYLFDMQMLASLFVGGTLTATSIGITVRVLGDLNRRSSYAAQIVIGAAVLDDVFGVMALAILYDFSVHGDVSLQAIGDIALFLVLFMALGPIVAKIVGWVIQRFDKKSESPGLLVTMIVSLIMLFSYLAHLVGAPAILGGFAAGIAMGQKFGISLAGLSHLPGMRRAHNIMRPNPELTHRLESQMRPLIHLFTPIFFVMVGVSLDFHAIDWTSLSVLSLSVALIIAAIFGKMAAGYLIRESRLRQAAIGLSMVPRGEVGLIFAQVGLTNGILNPDLYAAMLIVIIITTVLPPFALKAFYMKWGDRAELE